MDLGHPDHNPDQALRVTLRTSRYSPGRIYNAIAQLPAHDWLLAVPFQRAAFAKRSWSRPPARSNHRMAGLSSPVSRRPASTASRVNRRSNCSCVRRRARYSRASWSAPSGSSRMPRTQLLTRPREVDAVGARVVARFPSDRSAETREPPHRRPGLFPRPCSCCARCRRCRRGRERPRRGARGPR